MWSNESPVSDRAFLRAKSTEISKMVFTSFRTKDQADGFASCLDTDKVKWIDVEQDSDGRWVVMYQPR